MKHQEQIIVYQNGLSGNEHRIQFIRLDISDKRLKCRNSTANFVIKNMTHLSTNG